MVRGGKNRVRVGWNPHDGRNHPVPSPGGVRGPHRSKGREVRVPPSARESRPPIQVPREKGKNNGWDGRRFGVCPGCRWYEERREERETGLVFVTRRWCRLFRREISDLGDFVGCRRREEDERSRDV